MILNLRTDQLFADISDKEGKDKKELHILFLTLLE